MAVKHSTIAEFNGAQDDWDSYTEHLDQYFVANDITDVGKKRAILLSLCGSGTYEIIKSLVAPKKPTDHTYSHLVKLVQTHFKPTPSEIVSRYHFNRRVRQPGESVAQYIAELRRMTEYCNYGDTLE